MQTNNPPADFERPMLRMGSVALIAGVVITVVSTLFHASSEDLTNHPVVFAVSAQSGTWIAAHIGQFAGVMLIFAGEFVALFRLLVGSESRTASALSWFGLVVAIVTASTFAILQAVDGIALKMAVNSWYATPVASEEKAIAFRIAEGIRWTEIGINSYFRILQGTVGIIFGIAIAKSAILSRWIGAVGIAVGAASIAAGVVTAYIGFSDLVADLALILYAWIVILGIFMWRKTRAKKMISR
jgi:hypothetical protein